MDMDNDSESSAFFEQLYLRSCALKCKNEESKKDCVKGCDFATGKPLKAAVLALNIIGLEDQEVLEKDLNLEERKVVENRIISIGTGIQRGCNDECMKYCSSRINNSTCRQACANGCQYFVFPLINSCARYNN